MSEDVRVMGLPDDCLVCGAPANEVGPDAGAFTVCPLRDDADACDDEPDAWETCNCLDEQLSEAAARAWIEARRPGRRL